MCGIAVYGGRVGAMNARLVSAAMSEALIHRGPDDKGTIVVCMGDGEQHIALAHRRLAIIDLSTAGRQPMAWDGGALQIVYNGEIYNYVELRDELRGLGHEFRTATDTEVILAAYAQWGSECLQRFNGMWAFALWDGIKRELFCAVDRSGIKPFYYWSDGTSFAAASEIKALLKVPRVPSRPSSSAVLLYLESTIDHAPSTTFFEGISRLPGGHSLRITADGVSKPQRWWRPSVEELPRSEPALAEIFLDVLRDSIRLRFRSDVPVGVNLSGGVDSSAILYVTADLAHRGEISLPQGLRAFTASAREEEDIDEGGAARRSALQCGAQHYVVAPSGDDLLRDVSSLVWHQDEPFGSLSTFMQFAVMRLVRETGTIVTLSGQGPDELLMGYPWHSARVIGQAIAGGEWKGAVSQLLHSWQKSDVALRKIAGYLLEDLAPWARIVRYRLRSRWLLTSAARAVGLSDVYATALTPSLASATTHEIESVGLPGLLRYEDRNSMAFGVESRLPFLDHRLLNIAYNLPLAMHMKGGWSKSLLRRAVQTVMPSSVVWQKRKIGFEAPLAALAPAVRRLVSDVMTDGVPRINPLVRTSVLLERQRQGRVNSQVLWRALNVELWLRRFGLSF